MSNQLLPCPFCGAEPTPYTWKAVGCMTPNCAMEGLHIYHEAWNRRATQSAAGEPVAWVEPVPLDGMSKDYYRGFGHAACQALILNATSAQPAAAPVAAGEPVAFVDPADLDRLKAVSSVDARLYRSGSALAPLFAAPPAAAHGDEAEPSVDFAAWLIDHREGQAVTEEDMHEWLGEWYEQRLAMRAQAGEGGE